MVIIERSQGEAMYSGGDELTELWFYIHQRYVSVRKMKAYQLRLGYEHYSDWYMVFVASGGWEVDGILRRERL